MQAHLFDILIVDDAHMIPDFSTHAFTLTRLGKSIIFSAINNTTEGTAWPSVSRIITCCDQYEHLTRDCENCARPNSCFSYRIIGSQDAGYRALCRACFRYMRAQESPVVLSPSPGSPQRKLSLGTPRE
jgi:thymidine kinase